MTTILLLAANPTDTPKLEVYQEIYEIDQGIRSAKYNTQFNFIPRTAVKRSDLLKFIDEYNPDIIHFSGHGDSSAAIYLADKYDEREPVSPETIRKIFKSRKKSVKCIVFNTCYLIAQADEVAEEIKGVVIGVTTKLTDQDAIGFSKEFYHQLANGKDVSAAYNDARLQIKNEETQLNIHCTPSVAPNKIKFVKRIPFIVELAVLLLLALLVPALSIQSFISIFYSFFPISVDLYCTQIIDCTQIITITAKRETTIIRYVASIAGILGVICGMTWNRYLRPRLLSFLSK